MAPRATPQLELDAMTRAFTLSIVDGFLAAVETANSHTAKIVLELAQVLRDGPSSAERTQAYRTLGENAQRSILASYAQTVTRNKRAADMEPYRLTGPNRRYAGGALYRALASSDFWEADERGLRLINVGLLDKEARHWARLNAGAGGVGQGSQRRFEVRWSNLIIAAIGIDMTPSAAFTIPKGYWFDAGEGVAVPPSGQIGDHQFYPVGTGPRGGTSRIMDRGGAGSQSVPFQRRKPTRGIVARNFLDAGLARVARDLPDVYERMYGDFYDRAVARVKPARKVSSSISVSYNFRSGSIASQIGR